ncbi:MAG: translation initiation factor IF-2 N-terminal domain-containing protein, partial [bacterium]|nr:translation initiation factor IF-2 N-terminal domain-containing protein [bacterium]
MAKMKIYELAKNIDVHSKDIIEFLKNKGIEVKSHMSNIEDDQVALVKKQFSKNYSKPAPANVASKEVTIAKPEQKDETTQTRHNQIGSDRKQNMNENKQSNNNRPQGTQNRENRPAGNGQGGQRSNQGNNQGNRNNSQRPQGNGQSRPNNNNGQSRP